MAEPIRILHVLGGLSIGGTESRIMDLYRCVDREKMQFDFLIHTDKEQHFEKEIEKMGGKIYRVPRFLVYNWFGYKKKLKQFFSNHHEFRAVHGHMTSTAAIYLPIAKKAGIPITIAHARSAGVDSGLKGWITRLLRLSLHKKADYLLTCSKEAGYAVYGKKCMDSGAVEIVPNAIDALKYCYDPVLRKQKREELGIGDKWVIGHVGSFREAKNHTFLIRIFKEILAKRPDAVLLLVGDGPLRPQIEEQVRSLGMEERVLFCGRQSRVNGYYQAMDFLVFPSLYEGLPGTVVEAQVAGLNCLVSDHVTKEVGITKAVTFMELNRPAEDWADFVVKNAEYTRESLYEEVCKAGFDITTQLKRYQEIYKMEQK